MENVMGILPREFSGIFTIAVIAFYVFWILIHIVFSIAVYIDASKRQTYLVGPFLWAFVTLFGGVLFAGVYCIVNRLAVKDNVTELNDLIVEINRSKADNKVEEKLKGFKSRFNK